MLNDNSNVPSLNLRKLSFKQIIVGMLTLSLLIGMVSVAVYQGWMSPDQASFLINNWQGKMDRFESDLAELNGTLQVSWNPTFYTTSNALATYAIYNLTGATNYYAVQNMSTTGRLWFYQSNFTSVEQNVLGNMTEGTVILSQMRHNYSLTVSASCAVIESVNGLERVFINSANIQGDSYLVTVDNIVSGYYLAQDSAGRYINSYSTTTFETLFQNLLDLGGEINLQPYTTFTSVSKINQTSNCNVNFHGATIKVVSNSIFPAINVYNIVNSTWSNGRIERDGTNSVTGTISNHMAVLCVRGTTDNTTTYHNMMFYGNVDNTGGIRASMIGTFNDTASPILYNCVFTGSGVGTGTSNPAVYLWDFTTASFYSCIFKPMLTSSSSFGFEAEGGSQPSIFGGEIHGSQGNSGTAVLIYNSASPKFVGVNIYGGSNGTYCHAVRTQGVCKPIFSGCNLYYGIGGVGSRGFSIEESSAPIIDSSNVFNPVSSSRYYYTVTGMHNRPYEAKPYVLLTIELMVYVPVVGCTVDIGTTEGGHEIAEDVNVSTTGYKTFDYNVVEIASGGYIYFTPSEAMATQAFSTYYTAITNYDNTNAIYLKTLGPARINGGTFQTNAASDCVKLYDESLSNMKWIFSNSVYEVLDDYRYTITAQTNTTEIPIYNCVLLGGTTPMNVTFASGTTYGTNVKK